MSEFVEVSTQDLSGAALDWAIGYAVRWHDPDSREAWAHDWLRCYCPSTDWIDGGPLIEKYKLDIGAPMENKSGPWNAATEWGHPNGYKGETPLIAACRAIVVSVLGDTVSVPKELLS